MLLSLDYGELNFSWGLNMTFAKTLKRFSLVVALILTIAGGMAVNGFAADTGVKVTNSRFLPSNPGQIKLSFVRLSHMAPNQFIIRAAFSVATSGCDQFIMPPSRTHVEGNILNIFLQSPALVNINPPKHPEYECSGKAQQPYTDIVLSGWLINENNINKIAITNEEYGLRKEFIINLTSSFIEIYPASGHDAGMIAFQTQNLQHNTNALKFWFYPMNTVILYVPMADDKQDLSKEVAELARKKGFKSLEKTLLGFTKPITNPNYFYYVDTKQDSGTVIDSPQKLGTIQTTETVYGLMDDEIQTKELDVFMKTPGLYE